MARFARITILQQLIDTGLVPVFYSPHIDEALGVVAACARANCNHFEFTNRGDHAIEIFTQLEKICKKDYPNMILGVGSIADASTAALYIAHGANFVVGPMLNAEIARLCNRKKIPYMPGCASVTEISQAEELGCEIVKIFPAEQIGGPNFVKAVKGPCPWTSIMPTSGVANTKESLQKWFGAGVSCVGMGSNLITKEILKSKQYDELTASIKTTLDWIKEIRE